MFEENQLNRFSGTRHLYGDSTFKRILHGRALVVGLGGVGSWVVEGLVRSGVGAITLVDFDDICISNTNRQIQALTSEVGRQKAQVLKERCLQINPDLKIQIVEDFFSKNNASEILGHPYDVVLDCMDDSLNKELLIQMSLNLNIPLVVAGAAGGRSCASSVCISDLSKTREDSLLSQIRKRLRRRGVLPRGAVNFGIPAVHSKEKVKFFASGEVSLEKPSGDMGYLNCNFGMGSSMVVTATFAMFMVQQALNFVSSSKRLSSLDDL